MDTQKLSNGRHNRTLSCNVAEILTRRIVSGEYPVRSKLPTERLLSEEFGVNRHAVREALKRLEAIGLVEIKHGSGIYVQPLHLTAGIEIFDAMLFHIDGSIDPVILSNMLDFRRHVMTNLTQLSLKGVSLANWAAYVALLMTSVLIVEKGCWKMKRRFTTVFSRILRQLPKIASIHWSLLRSARSSEISAALFRTSFRMTGLEQRI